MHRSAVPDILYLGTPVVLVTTLNSDGTPNLAPFSSAWWLGWTCVLGLNTAAQTTQNLMRGGECVINMPHVDLVDAVDRLALTSGRDPLPGYKAARGFRFVRDKFAAAGLTAHPSVSVAPPRVLECPIHLEGRAVRITPVGSADPRIGSAHAVEIAIERVHIDDKILLPGKPNHIDPRRWRPLIMSFCHFFGLGEIAHPSRLADAFGQRFGTLSDGDSG